MKENWLIAGDVNFHLETDEPLVKRFKDIVINFDLVQYVNFPTHNLGHTLDLVLAQKDSPKICNLEVNDVQLSDHYMVSFNVEADVVKYDIRTITYRNFQAEGVADRFMAEVKEKHDVMIRSTVNPTMGERISQYNSSIRELVEKYYPTKTKQIKVVPHAPWFDSEYKNLRALRRKAEKKSKKTKSPADKEAFVKLRKETTQMALKKQKDFYERKISECVGQKEMYSCVNRLLDRKQESVLPEHTSSAELANQFAKYFKEKIHKIRESFSSAGIEAATVESFEGTPLVEFKPATEEEIRSIILQYGIKCAPHDPIPVNLLKTTYEVFIPIWTELVNLSLSQGSMECLKSGVLLPLIKELNSITDIDVFKNYRPVTNLQFVGKLIERVVKTRFDSHMDLNNLQCSNQYGYKSEHSTEMLMTKVTNDLLLACDKKTPTLLMFLDLSAAFDTVDQEKLLNILDEELGIRGTVLKWFRSFLQGRTQCVKIGESYSEEESLDFGVAQGSILGPPLFNAYTRSFPGKVKVKVRYTVEGYADDHQLYKQFNLVCQVEFLSEDIDNCFSFIESWMSEFFLKLNATKTKIMIIAPSCIRDEIIVNGTFINGKCLRFVDIAKNLGVLFDNELTFEAQIKKVVTSCFSTIRLLARIKYFLSSEQLNTLVCSLIFSTLDYCNALYYGLNVETVEKLQRVQNTAARLVLKVNRFDHVSTNEMFEKLHWLKIKERIVFKILLIVHKCVNGQAPEELSDMFQQVKSDRTRKLDVKYCNGLMGERAISVSGPKLWNALPQEIRLETSTDDFKKRLKTFLFKDADRFYDTVYRK